MDPFIPGAIVAVVTAFAGYYAGRLKTFREGKQKAYEEIIPGILKVAYHAESKDEVEFNKALSKLWLYGSRKVALKMDHAISIMHSPQCGDLTAALQDAVAEMRKDIQPPYARRVGAQEVKHIYSRIASINDYPAPEDMRGEINRTSERR
jgi:hypothetical protein